MSWIINLQKQVWSISIFYINLVLNQRAYIDITNNFGEATKNPSKEET